MYIISSLFFGTIRLLLCVVRSLQMGVTRVEQFTTAPATRHELRAFQASTENISNWELVNHGAL